MIFGAIIFVCWVILMVVWTMNCLFMLIDRKYNNEEKKIEQVHDFIVRNDISPSEAQFLYRLLDE